MLTVAQIAADLHVSPDAVRKWIASGQLKATKFGTQHAISEQDYQQFKLTHSSKRGRKVNKEHRQHEPLHQNK